jgi:hypothetical protein
MGREAAVDVRIDAVHGIEYRTLPHRVRTGWLAQWRPCRAIRAFPSFAFMTRSERFATAEDALAFVRENAGHLVARQL